MTKTVKVRIAVAVRHDGAWEAVGSPNQTDDEAYGTALDCMLYCDGVEQLARYHVTAELAIPESAEVEGVVDEGDSTAAR